MGIPYVHEKWIVHPDLKSETVPLDEQRSDVLTHAHMS